MGVYGDVVQWDYTEGDANPVFYAFSQVPFYNSNSVNYYEQYFWSAGKTDERVFEEDSAAARDIYHCTSYACEFYCGSARPSARDCVVRTPREDGGGGGGGGGESSRTADGATASWAQSAWSHAETAG